MNKFVLLLLSGLFFLPLLAEAARPQVALVLSGGGARGFAHLGVIEVLEEKNIPIDMIIGTSMGAAIGGLYACGLPIQTLKEICLEQKWNDLIENTHYRHFKYYRRKNDDEIYLIKRNVGLKNGSMAFPYGIFHAQPLYQFFNTFVLAMDHQGNFDRLPIRFRAIASDLETGKPVILEKGDLALSMLASMSVPGVFTPITIGDQLLVDGGVGANLPIEIAKNMGADIIIAVDVTTELSVKSEIIGVGDVAQQLTTILTANNVNISKAALRSQDILIIPELEDIKTSDFDKIALATVRGKKAASKALNNIVLPSRTNEPAFAERKPLTIHHLNIHSNKPLNRKTIDYYLDFQNKPISPTDLSQKMSYLYGLNVFENIFYTFNEKEEHTLYLEPLVDRWGPTYLQGSLYATTDFSGDSRFTLTLGATRLLLNNLMGEWRILGKVGDESSLFTEIYQPLTSDLKWFINPALSYERIPLNFYTFDQQVSKYLMTVFNAEFSMGRVLGNWGQLKVGLADHVGGLKALIGAPVLTEEHFHHDEAFIQWDFDTFDNNYFPRSGTKGTFTFSAFDHLSQEHAAFNQLDTHFLLALSHKKHAVTLSATYNRTFEGTPGIENQFFLGGPFQLSGYLNNRIYGDNALLADLIYYYMVKKLSITPNLTCPIYLGTSFEAGKVWGNSNLNQTGLIGANGIFIGSETNIGPLYLIFGSTTTGHHALHLVINRLF